MEYYPYKYFSGANVTVEIGNQDAFECAGISFMVNESNQPVYGYASTLYDAVIPGRRIIQGSFVVNFVGEDIKVLNNIRNSGESFYRNQFLFDININYGIGSQNKTNYKLSKCFFISQGQTIQISENVILEEFSFIARDVSTYKDPPKQIIEDTELPESKAVNAKSVDFSSNIYEYKLFDPTEDDRTYTIFNSSNMFLSQSDMNIIAGESSNNVNYQDKEELINNLLREIYEHENIDIINEWETLDGAKEFISTNVGEYPDSFIAIAYEFALYYNNISEFKSFIDFAENNKEFGGSLENFFSTSTLTWKNDTTGSN